MVNYPDVYSKDFLQIWYEEKFQSELNLEKMIEERRDGAGKFFLTDGSLIKDSTETNAWSELYRCINAVLESKLHDFDISGLSFEPSLYPKGLNEFKENFVKKGNKISNKYWRKNKKNKDEKKEIIELEPFLDSINDLVRFSIKVDSLNIAEIFAKEIAKIPSIHSNPIVADFYNTYLESVKVDHELKMISGYFAYHCYFNFKEGYTVEMQIFSELSNYWRKLSHHIYEKLRDEPKTDYKYNDVESRMVAMGHLLYLADCELNNIENELEINK